MPNITGCRSYSRRISSTTGYMEPCGWSTRSAIEFRNRRSHSEGFASRIRVRQCYNAGRMDAAERLRLTARMRSEWNDRARKNARFYINNASAEWTDEEFFRTGEENVEEHILTDMHNICQGMAPQEMNILEIGCGAGRLTRALARVFGSIHAVD